MKTILKTNLVVFALFLSLTAMGQGRINHFYYNYLDKEKPVEFGVKAGLNMSTFSGLDDANSKLGFIGGLTLDFNFSKRFYVLTGVDFVNKGTKLDFNFDYDGLGMLFKDTKIDAMYIQVPIHAGGKMWIDKKVKVSVHGGPYIAYGVGGQLKLSDRLTKTNHDGTVVDMTLDELITGGVRGFKREWETFAKKSPNGVPMSMYEHFDWGLGLGLSVEYERAVLGINYDFGIEKISRGLGKERNRAGYITIGYKLN